MDLDDESKSAPRPQNITSTAQPILVLGNAVTDLVDRMEAEVADRGTINDETANELRDLRVAAEQLVGRSNARSLGDR